MKTYNDALLSFQKYLLDNKKDESVAKLAMQHVLQIEGADFFLFLREEVDEDKLNKIQEILSEYVIGIPYQYIVGYTYFYGHKILVNKDVLIPRFDTENLVDAIIKKDGKITSFCDVGTGSGCIAIALQNKLNCKCYASDISSNAIEVAKNNAKLNNVKINFLLGDMLKPYKENNIKVDMIVSNPPYIKEDDTNIDEEVKNNEPHIALFAKENGLEFYKSILLDAPKILNKNGLIYFEIGFDQKDDLLNLIDELITSPHLVDVINDLSNKNRVIRIKLD